MTRKNISSGAPWERIVGYSRAVRIGNTIAVTGTVGVDDDGQPVGDTEAQTRKALEKIQSVLQEAGASLEDVIRTRMFVTNIDEWEIIGRVHAEFFGSIMPATSMLEISRLIAPGLTIEIEADAILTEE